MINELGFVKISKIRNEWDFFIFVSRRSDNILWRGLLHEYRWRFIFRSTEEFSPLAATLLSNWQMKNKIGLSMYSSSRLRTYKTIRSDCRNHRNLYRFFPALRTSWLRHGVYENCSRSSVAAINEKIFNLN